MSKVSIIKCEEYNLELVKQKIIEAVDLISGLDSFIKKDDRVFIKLNCLGAFSPEMAITTNPVFVQAVIQLVKKITPNIIVGDNPAFKDLIPTLKKNKLYNILVEENVQILNQEKSIIITNSAPKLYSTFEVAAEMVNVDVLINLPKLKTHSLAYMTCAQKNMFGLIYGLDKAKWHAKAPNPLNFGEAINDLYGAFLESYKDKKLLHICDGIIGLEGEGPSTGGIPKKTNIIIASIDAVSLDRVALEVVKLDPKKLYINTIASDRGYGEGSLENIQILGNKLDDFADIAYLPPKDSLSITGLRILKIKPLKNLLLEHPKINHKTCVKCGECIKICPPNALKRGKQNFPKLKSTDCIRCWCCSEVCPKNAISKTKRPLIGRIFFRSGD